MPIYNKEKYIDKCIQSIQNQTLKDIEIIAVNDCSTDNSLKKLMNLAINDDRIKIVNNDKNHGLLYSRAMGITNSSGEYLINIDPDDTLYDKENLEYLYNTIIKFNADIITFDIFDEKRNKIIKCQNKGEIQKQPKLFESLFTKSNSIKEYVIWNKLIKKEIFLKAYEFFKNEIFNLRWNYDEDEIWNILVNRYAETKLCVNKLVYKYNFHKDSLMNKRNMTILIQNFIYRHNMYKKIFSKKEEEKYLIVEYNFLFNWLKNAMKQHRLIKDYKINNDIMNIFLFFINNYNCSVTKKNDIINFLRTVSYALKNY